jgi:Tfp pilus assembly protein PilV
MRTRGLALVEVLAATLLLAMAAAAAIATWGLSTRTTYSKRLTEMGTYVATQEVERLKARRSAGLQNTASGSPLLTYYDRFGAPAGAQAAQGFTARSWVRTVVDRDETVNTEDVREIYVEIRDNTGAFLLGRARTLITYGGV